MQLIYTNINKFRGNGSSYDTKGVFDSHMQKENKNSVFLWKVGK